MSAREDLIRSVYSKLSQNQMEELVDAFAHELAEEIRGTMEYDGYGARKTAQISENVGKLAAADLIDPRVPNA
ncbi:MULTISPECIES: hypothetical protein [unclassified Streptomyces]|uniref:hypothetical protein n=1 Tax=unclassified Streptomyces TaxID=2593676 RepID=UPI000A9D0E37|nr:MULTISPECIES: hypothetical protein [unclassified Streptomyces]